MLGDGAAKDHLSTLCIAVLVLDRARGSSGANSEAPQPVALAIYHLPDPFRTGKVGA